MVQLKNVPENEIHTECVEILSHIISAQLISEIIFKLFLSKNTHMEKKTIEFDLKTT